jgi:DNA ligase-1
MPKTSSEIMALIEDIANIPGTNDKVAHLAEHYDASVGRVLVAACDPRIRYYIIEPELPSSVGIHDFTDATWSLLGRLSERKANRGDVMTEMQTLNPSSIELLRRIINKDLRADIGDSLINRAVPNLIYKPMYMRCSLVTEVKLETWPWASGVVSQEKLDGMFINIDVFENAVSLHSRQGQVFDPVYFKELVNDIKGYLRPGFQYHGEMMLEPIGGGPFMVRKTSNGIFNSCLKKGTGIPEGFRPVAILWDIKSTTLYYLDRFKFITDQIDGCKTLRAAPTTTVYSFEEAKTHFEAIVAKGGEGVVIKKPYMIWRDGDSRDQVKLKKEAQCELRVVGVKAGKGKFASTFGSLECISECGKLKVNVSGFTEPERQMIHDNIGDYMFNIISVKFESVSQDKKGNYSLSQPRFEELRLDKDEADYLERILEL